MWFWGQQKQKNQPKKDTPKNTTLSLSLPSALNVTPQPHGSCHLQHASSHTHWPPPAAHTAADVRPIGGTGGRAHHTVARARQARRADWLGDQRGGEVRERRKGGGGSAGGKVVSALDPLPTLHQTAHPLSPRPPLTQSRPPRLLLHPPPKPSPRPSFRSPSPRALTLRPRLAERPPPLAPPRRPRSVGGGGGELRLPRIL